MKNIIIIGDPIEDIYTQIKNNKTLSSNIIPGGASNVFENVKYILSNSFTSDSIFFIPELLFTDKYLYKILRLNNEKDIHLCSFEDKQNYYSDLKYLVQRQLNLILEKSSTQSTIIFSDYNKGILNTACPKYKGLKKVENAIVDSKYNSLHPDFFNYANNYILRCTGKEYNFEFAKQFLYTVWTDGPKPVILLDADQNIIQTFDVPQIKPIDTCGAGDTFTATLAAYIHKNGLTLHNIKEAIELSIESSLSVITKNKTAVTNIKI